jgi:hypothetical protein
MLAIQCGQSGWEPRAGGRFVVEFEMSDSPKISTGNHRNRLWRLLNEDQRRRATDINNFVSQTLPEPDQKFLAILADSVREHYLRAFAANPVVPNPTADVWFRYYDESDAGKWAEFLGDSIVSALNEFLERPPSFMGWMPNKS